MAKYFIIGEVGDNRLWLVNTHAGNVQELGPLGIDTEGAAEAKFVEIVQNMRNNGQVIVKNINVAIATNDRSDAQSRALSPSPSP